MLALDTNVVVRYVADDHPEQSARARTLVDGSDAFICTTVILEAEWVLRSVYGFAAARVAAALRGFAGLPRVRVEEPRVTAQALEWAERGLDFADALHLAKAEGCEALASFDRRFARAARGLGGVAVREP